MIAAVLVFSKLQAAGNGYLATDGRGLDLDWSALARAMCRDHFGVGSNGLLVALPSESAEIRMRVFNSDGSEAEMSGNGVRLFAKFVLDRGIASAGPDGLQVETGAGLRTVVPHFREGRMVSGRVAMGEPVFAPARIPVVAPASGAGSAPLPVVLELGGGALRVHCLSLGNPHAVHFCDGPLDDFPLADVGPRVERHPAFPNRTNFEVVQVERRDRLRARVYERGEGETLSSGTGSTAAAVAARASGRTGDEVEVALPGGVLRVRWPGSGPAFLEGPTVEVFTGTWPGTA